jgi:hypothetical protein
VLIAVYAEHRWVKVLGVSYPILTTLVVIATGNHYLLDAIAGGITMAAGALLAAALPHRSKPAPLGPEQEQLPAVPDGVQAAAARVSRSTGRETQYETPSDGRPVPTATLDH